MVLDYFGAKMYYLKLFTDGSRLEKYLNVLVLSVIGKEDEIPVVPLRLSLEISEGLAYTQSLPNNYDIRFGPRILYALFNDKNEIIGTITANEDGHVSDFAQAEYVAIRRDFQNQGLGKLMLEKFAAETSKHCAFNGIVLTTVNEGRFYESCGFKKCGEVKTNAILRNFYVKEFST